MSLLCLFVANPSLNSLLWPGFESRGRLVQRFVQFVPGFFQAGLEISPGFRTGLFQLAQPVLGSFQLRTQRFGLSTDGGFHFIDDFTNLLA